MKKLLSILLFLPLLSIAQLTTKDTSITFNGLTWRARVTTHASFNSLYATNTFPAIIYPVAFGEVGTDTSKIAVFGPHKWIRNGGKIYKKLATGDTLWPVVITYQPTSAYPNEVNQKTFLDILINRYHLRKGTALYGVGYSHGGWCLKTFVTGDPYGQTTLADYFTSLADILGMKPDDNSPYPQLFDNYANSGGKIYFAEQSLDGRDQATQANRMNAAVAGSAIHRIYNFGNGGHTCCVDNWMGGTSAPVDTFLLFGKQQSIYSWLLSSGDTTMPTPPAGLPVARAGADQTWNMPKTSTTLNGGASTGVITSIQWRKIGSPFPSHSKEGVITNANSLVATVSNFGVGDYTYELVVSDGTNTSKDTVVIHGLPFKSKTPNPTGRKILLTPSGGEYYYPNIITSLGQLNGTDTLVLTQSANLLQAYGDDGSGGWGGDSVNKLVIMGAPGVTLRQLRCDGQYIKIQDIAFNNPNTSPDIALGPKHYAIEVTNCTMTAGDNFIYAKAVIDTTNVLTYGNNWDFKYNYFHHNTVSNSNGEAMYLGHTFSDEDKLAPSTFASYPPVKMSYLRVYYNTIKNAGWDGIQTSYAPYVKIKFNTIDSTGLQCKSAQLNGIIAGGYSPFAEVDSNDIRNTKSAAIAIFGNDTAKVRGNVIVNGGYADIQTDLNCASGNPYTAIDVNDNITPSIGAPLPSLVAVIQNNCIQQITSYNSGAAIRVRNGNGTMRPGIISGNKIGDPIGGRLLSNLIFDASGSSISGNSLGTCSPVNISPNASAGADQTITLPINSITLDASSSTDPDGSIVSYLWEQVSGPTQATIGVTNAASTIVANLAAGVYVFKLTVTDNSGASATDDVQIVVNATGRIIGQWFILKAKQ